MTRDHNFATSLLARGRAHPDRMALAELASPGAREWTSVTYGELSLRIESFSRGLGEAGVTRGDRVVLMLPPSIESTAVYFALVALGASPVDWDSYPDDPDFVVLADTEGNRFCVVDASHG